MKDGERSPFIAPARAAGISSPDGLARRAETRRVELEAMAMQAMALAKALAEGAGHSPDTLLVNVEKLRSTVKICRYLVSSIARSEGVGGW